MNKTRIISIIIILLICISTISVVKKEHIQSDTFFSVAVGDRIVEYGFEEEDQLTWHEGLRYIYLRWGFDVIVNALYDVWGLDGIQVFIVIISVVQALLYYFILNNITKKKIFSLICTMLMMWQLSDEFAGRAQIISFLLFIIEYYCIEKLIETNRNKYFWSLMILPLILVNFHASTYPLYFMFYLPYIAEFILAKLNLKSDSSSKLIIEKRNINKLFILVLFGIVFGFCSPSGIDSYKYVFKVMGAISADFISEMQSMNILEVPILFVVICLYLGIIAFTKTKVRIVDCFLVLGITIMSLNTIRYSFFFFLIASIPIFKLLNNFLVDYEVNFDFINSKVKIGIYSFGALIIILSSCNSIISNYSRDYINTQDFPTNAAQYILSNIDVSQMRIYNHFNFGGYLELLGIPAFVDARAEMYEEEFNDTEVLVDWYLLDEGEESYKNIFDKYKITHALLYNFNNINKYIVYDEEWNVLYQDEVFTLYEKVSD